jgi:hypothetical protein
VRVTHLHSILNLGNKRTLGNECKKLSLHFVGKGDNEAHKDHHLCHQKQEDLEAAVSISQSSEAFLDEHDRRVNKGSHACFSRWVVTGEDWDEVTKL